MDVKATWERWGKVDPYWGVCSHPEFRAGRLDDRAREAFFRSGEDDVGRTLAAVRRFVRPGFRPERTLDYGCGVGRLTIPLAREGGWVVGVDVSGTMLDEARRNCAARRVTNVELVLAGDAGDALAGVTGDFDFVNSYIVFQHVPPRLGEAITRALLERLRPGGVGALHFTYGWRAGLARRALHRVRRSVPLAHAAANVLQRRPLRAPIIPMYAYDMSRLFALLHANGCERVHALLTDHDGHLGAHLLFERAARRAVQTVELDPARA